MLSLTRKIHYNLLAVLGPTASGKTRLGVGLARHFGGEILSADSRQVYRGLDIGAGKDLSEYSAGGAHVPYHLIDIVGLDVEFSVFDYQQRFFELFEDTRRRSVLPVLVGGTGLYIEAVLRGYRMVEAPEDSSLRAELSAMPYEALVARLLELKPELHNTSDLTNRERLVRAIEIATHTCSHEPAPAPDIRAFILGARWPREELRRRIRERLVERLDTGLVGEVEGLVRQGVSWEKLDFLGLEYRYVSQYLKGEIATLDELIETLHARICQFAKRQETWFRRMERQGADIHWVDRADFQAALRLIPKDAFAAP